ncbi:hypothetical protein [Cellvibrio mixtus]|uniref:hypothetical protein n=1 Tax=Cellvibrio mixtus TaxID=39650 RepID=UPI000586596C|nr:hypothetical protein [Cellvibrio mixtus]
MRENFYTRIKSHLENSYRHSHAPRQVSVYTKDLEEMVYHFERLDAMARAMFEHPDSIKRLRDQLNATCIEHKDNLNLVSLAISQEMTNHLAKKVKSDHRTKYSKPPQLTGTPSIQNVEFNGEQT